jgi:hypothetical protein
MKMCPSPERFDLVLTTPVMTSLECLDTVQFEAFLADQTKGIQRISKTVPTKERKEHRGLDARAQNHQQWSMVQVARQQEMQRFLVPQKVRCRLSTGRKEGYSVVSAARKPKTQLWPLSQQAKNEKNLTNKAEQMSTGHEVPNSQLLLTAEASCNADTLHSA